MYGQNVKHELKLLGLDNEIIEKEIQQKFEPILANHNENFINEKYQYEMSFGYQIALFNLLENLGYKHIQIGYCGCIKVKKNQNGIFYIIKAGKGTGKNIFQSTNISTSYNTSTTRTLLFKIEINIQTCSILDLLNNNIKNKIQYKCEIDFVSKILEFLNNKIIISNCTYKDIYYIEAFADYVKIWTSQVKRVVTLQTMRNMESGLPSKLFIRIHRSYIIAITTRKTGF